MIISQTPLRISFFGGGTDLSVFYAEDTGRVLSTSIDKYIYVIVKERYDDQIVLNYSKKEKTSDIDLIEHELIREVLKKVGIFKGVEITTLSDIPSEGSGLGSSSSLLVGLLNACYSYVGLAKDNYCLAAEACEIEINILNKPIGKQDQFAAAFGGLKVYEFYSSDLVGVKKTAIGLKEIMELQRHLFLVYTGITRKSSFILEKQAQNSYTNHDVLCEIADMPLTAKMMLEENRFDAFGELLHEAWINKKKLAQGISNETIDTIYDKGIKYGALGGKVLGAGGGGFVLFYVPDIAINQFMDFFSKEYKMLPFRFTREGTRVIFNNGRNEHML